MQQSPATAKTPTADKISQKAAPLQHGTTAPAWEGRKPPQAAAQNPPSSPQTGLQPAAAATSEVIADGFEAYLKRYQRDFSMVLPRHVPIDRVMRLALSAIRRSPGLLSCTMQSIAGGIMEACALGFEINSPLHQASLVPFNNKKTGRKEAQLIIEYRGYIDLFYRTEKVLTVYANVVYANDKFELSYGIDETLHHVPWHMVGKTDAGGIIGFYAYAKMKDGAYRFEYLPKAAVDAIRDEYASGYDPDDPDCAWIHDYVAMGKKTLIRRLEPWLPKSSELRYAVEADYSVIDPMKIETPTKPEEPPKSEEPKQ